MQLIEGIRSVASDSEDPHTTELSDGNDSEETSSQQPDTKSSPFSNIVNFYGDIWDETARDDDGDEDNGEAKEKKEVKFEEIENEEDYEDEEDYDDLQSPTLLLNSSQQSISEGLQDLLRQKRTVTMELRRALEQKEARMAAKSRAALETYPKVISNGQDHPRQVVDVVSGSSFSRKEGVERR